MTIEKLRPVDTRHCLVSAFTEDKLNQLKNIIPEAFADGKINFETLKEVLGENLEEENQDKEHFGLFWVGKRQARKIASIPSKGTLVPVKGEGIDEENTKNIFIEGDNLEVLKLLQKSYANKIKMIYIDPPYNTGNDFVYEDDFSEPIKEYLRRTGQVDEQGRELTTNKKSDGRFHAKWLNMMYPRLSLARNLLRDDGVIFISIDDNEVHNLKSLCNEIFGEENFKGQISRNTGTPTGQGNDRLVNEIDYILVYSKNEPFCFIGLPLNKEDEKIYDKKDNAGRYLTRPLRKTGGEDRREDRPSMYYAVKDPEGNDIFPIGPGGYESRWRCASNSYNELLQNGFIEWKKSFDNEIESWKPYQKFYLEGRLKQPTNLWSDIEGNKKASIDIKNIFNSKVFDFPKPIELIAKCSQISMSYNDIILDFFAGSGTTAHAILDLNKQDNKNRKFICVQIPEKTPEDSEAFKAGYKKISEITKERIRRVIKKIKSENEGKMDFQENNQDLGFKVFKLKESNYKEWKDIEGNNIDQLEIAFDNFASPLVENWKKEDVLSEIMLMEGFSLDSKINILSGYTNNEIYEIISEFSSYKLLVCLDQNLYDNTIDSLVLEENDIFICLDTAINDNDKIKLSDKGLIKTI